MNSGRVIFEKKTQTIKDGRKSEAWAGFYAAWADFPALSMREQTDVNNRQLTDAITLEVRVCQKVEAIRKEMKQFRAVHKGMVYELKGADYSRSRAGFIRFLASRAD